MRDMTAAFIAESFKTTPQQKYAEERRQWRESHPVLIISNKESAHVQRKIETC